ncbi:MAG TPA: hypothetical protein VFV48_09745, partial [Pseudomonadales bacterium]|nr:hypothetical protein [Pseudomonadales bacterium]
MKKSLILLLGLGTLGGCATTPDMPAWLPPSQQSFRADSDFYPGRENQNNHWLEQIHQHNEGVSDIGSKQIEAVDLPEEQYSLAYNSYSGKHTSLDATRFSVRNTLNADLSLGADVEHTKRYDDSFETSMSAKPYEEDQNS